MIITVHVDVTAIVIYACNLYVYFSGTLYRFILPLSRNDGILHTRYTVNTITSNSEHNRKICIKEVYTGVIMKH